MRSQAEAMEAWEKRKGLPQAEDIRGLYAEAPPPTFATEEAFQAHVIAHAREHGWDVRYEFDSKKSPRFWPDLELLRADCIMVAELKLDDDEVKQMPIGQCVRLLQYARAGVEAHLWRPSMLTAIEARLR